MMTVGDAVAKIMELPQVYDVTLKSRDGYMECHILYKKSAFCYHQKTVIFPNSNDTYMTTYAYWDAARTIRQAVRACA